MAEKGDRWSYGSSSSECSTNSSSDVPRNLVLCVTLSSVAPQKNVQTRASAQLTNRHGFGDEPQKLVGREKILQHCGSNSIMCSGQIHHMSILLRPSDVTFRFL